MPAAWVPGSPRRVEGGYLVPPGARLPALRSRDGGRRLWVGAGAAVDAIDVAGPVTMAAASRVEGDLRAGPEAVLGAGCEVGGRLTCGGRVVVQGRARVAGHLEAAGDVLLLGDAEVGDVRSGGDILVAGGPRTGRLEPRGRLLTRPW